MLIVITGSRSWIDEDAMRRKFSELPTDTTIMHGGADGADKMAERLGKYEFEFRVLPAVRPRYKYWTAKIGKPQGFKVAPLKRNGEMLELAVEHSKKTDEELKVLAFKDINSPTGGTDDCAAKAEEMGLEVEWTYQD